MANTEKLIIRTAWSNDINCPETIFFNNVVSFRGTLTEARIFAKEHGFGGGVEIATTKGGRTTYHKV